MNICEEKFELDVVRVDIYDRSDVSVSIPNNISYDESVESQSGVGVTIAVASGKSPLLTMDVEWTSGADAILENVVKAVVAEKKEIGGLIRTHTIEGTLIDGMEKALKASKEAAYVNTIAVLTTAYGDKYLCNAFINANTLNVKNDYENHNADVKYTAQSFSALIPVASVS